MHRYSMLLPQFLSNHVNWVPVLKGLWELNQEIVIRGMAELYRNDNTLMNLSRVLDISQEIKDSLLVILETQDYSFSVQLGILAGKRDFLHFDLWLSKRIDVVGTPFINALLHYIRERIVIPCKALEVQGRPKDSKKEESVLELSQLNQDKIVMIFENLFNLKHNQNK